MEPSFKKSESELESVPQDSGSKSAESDRNRSNRMKKLNFLKNRPCFKNRPCMELPTFELSTVQERLEVEDLIEKTMYGEQLSTIGAIIETRPGFEEDFVKTVVVRRVIHPLEMKNIDPFRPKSFDFLITPCMSYKDEQKDAFFVVYHRTDGGGNKYEMTFDWYMKKHRKMDANDGSLRESSIEPILVLSPGPDNNMWSFSGTFKKFLRCIVENVESMHGMACTHGNLSANNIIIFLGWEMYKRVYEVYLVNCLQEHDLDKEEENILFEARKQKDWEAILQLILDATDGIDGCFDHELTHFLNKLKISKEESSILTKDSFDHPSVLLRYQKEDLVRNMNVKIVAKKMSELGGFLEPGVDWRKLLHEKVLKEYQEEAWDYMGYYRRDFNGEFNDSIMDLLCFIKDSYNLYEDDSMANKIKCTGFPAMDLYLQSLFPDFFIKLHQLEEIDNLRYDRDDRETYRLL